MSYELANLNEFKNNFLSAFTSIGGVDDNLFQVKVESKDKPKFVLDIFHKIDKDGLFNTSNTLTTYILDESKLEQINETNFYQMTGLNLDITDANQLRQFIMDVNFIRLKVSNLKLMSFDSEDTLDCQKWSLEVTFDFNRHSKIKVGKKSDYDKIPCEEGWKKLIDYNEIERNFKSAQRVGFVSTC